MESNYHKLTIGYEFDFRLTVRKRNGKLYKNHHIIGLGISFNLALGDVYHKLKKRKSQIVAINNARAIRIAFAFDRDQQSVKVILADYPPFIPDVFDAELDRLPTT